MALVLGILGAGQLTAQNLSVDSGKLCLELSKSNQTCVPLKNAIAVLYRDAKGLHLGSVKTGLAPNLKALPSGSRMEKLPLKGLNFSLGKEELSWSVISGGKVLHKGSSVLQEGQEVIFHGDNVGSVFVLPDCVPTPILVREEGFEVNGELIGKQMLLGITPGEEGSRTIIACSGVGVAVDIIDNIIDDPDAFYGRIADDYLGRVVNEGSAPEMVEAQTPLQWREYFCSEFDLDLGLIDNRPGGLYGCEFFARDVRLALDCDGNLLVTKDGRVHRIALGDCSIVLGLTDTDQIAILAEEASCLSSLDCF